VSDEQRHVDCAKMVDELTCLEQ